MKMKKPTYKIKNVNQIEPFLMSLTSSDDHWMFISSNGALTAGREKADHALFPYITDNLIHTSLNTTGPKTKIDIYKNNEKIDTWIPLSYLPPKHNVEKNLYKDALGDNIVYEEINKDLKLSFRYQWLTSREFGFIKRTELLNESDEDLEFNITDGLQNILPSGLDVQTQQSLSNLSNAYKHSEIIQDTKLAIFSLGSLIMDRPDPGEALTANTAWVCSNINFQPSLIFPKTGVENKNENVITGIPGSYYINTQKKLKSDQKAEWDIILDVNQNHMGIVNLNESVNTITDEIDKSVKQNHILLKKYIGSSDGFQLTASTNNNLHHTSNVLFNIMRGGIFVKNYDINKNDFIGFLKTRNKVVYSSIKNELNQFKDNSNLFDLISFGKNKNTPSLLRLCYEYLPLTFGRRHGDPSRPWNQFNIKVNDGDSVLYYHEGNWRDIFQNWEGLSISYPNFLESMICKFLNACTKDGYNPYRINKDGIDWEVVDEKDTWSHIGYWNDHQIIYLLKLLESQWEIDRDFILNCFNAKIFSSANIPYKIKSSSEILSNPKDTIDFDHSLHQKIMNQVKEIGTDARLVLDGNQVVHVTMAEKVLILQLSKLSNFVPDGGIWLNTQRPEWNDANNALVGYGVSMVTLYYLNRNILFLNKILAKVNDVEVEISSEVILWFKTVKNIFKKFLPSLNNKIRPSERKKFVIELQKSFSDYRYQSYNQVSKTSGELKVFEFLNFNNLVLQHFEVSIKNNLNNALYGAYNTINIDKTDEINITPLFPMLEGQVSALSSGKVKPKEAIDILSSLYDSDMYQLEQNSFMLYPRKKLKRFLDKNIIPDNIFNDCNVFKKLIKQKNTEILYADSVGNYRFNESLINTSFLEKKLTSLSKIKEFSEDVQKEKNKILNYYLEIFDHQNYTGRSGTMYAYEGIGSIYWHMVSKLLLATQELFFKAKETNEDISVIKDLGEFYYKIRSGLSSDKTPEQYGAFPYDPYSHTPYKRGAQQPGMTGQVKEEIIARMGELGVTLKNGQLIFQTALLKISEFLREDSVFSYVDINQKFCNYNLKQKQLGFTYCQVPIIYQLSKKDWSLFVSFKDQSTETILGNSLPFEISKNLFSRSGKIKEIKVCCPKSSFMF